MSNNERLAKAEMYLSPNLVFLAWMTRESDIKITLTRTEQINCRGQVVQRKEQITLSGDGMTILRNFIEVIDQFIYFQRHKYCQNVGQQIRSMSSQVNLSAQMSTRNSNGSSMQ